MFSSADTDMKMKILLAAKRLFARQGFDGTTVRQICEEAGANVALVSYYFGGKENVFSALFTTFFPGRRLPEYEEFFQDPITGVKKIIEEVIRYRMSDPEMVAVLQQEIFKNSPRVGIIREQVFPVWRKLRELLRDGREKGLFDFRSLDNTMFFVMGTILFHKHAEYFSPLLEEDAPSLEDMCRDAIVFVLRGLGVPGKAEDYL